MAQTIKMSTSRRNLNALVAIAARDVVLTLKAPGSLAISLIMPIILLGVIGSGIIQHLASGFGFNYGTYSLVGTIVNMLFMITTMGMVSLVEDRQANFTPEMMVAPVSRLVIIVGKIIGSMFGALIGLLGTLAVGLVMHTSLSPVALGKMLLLSPLFCLTAGAITLLVISVIQNTRVASMVASFLVLPQMFLSGVILPISSSSPILVFLSKLMPMSYCVNLARAVVYAGTSQYSAVVSMSPWLSLITVIAINVVLLAAGTYLFSRMQTHR